VYAAIGEAREAIAHGRVPPGQYSIPLTEYRLEATGPGAYPQTVQVSLTDESARVNLNFAPVAVLRAMGLPEHAAQAVQDYRTKGGKRLANVDALRAEGLVDGQTFRALHRDLFTVYTASDPRQPHSYLNLNSAPEAVLAAVFGIGAEEAAALAAKRPFATWADVLQKVGREPSTFNVAAPQYALRDMPAELALSSRCYRLQSIVELDMPGGRGRLVHAGVEAVVAFLEDGTYTIRYWRELHSGAAKEVSGDGRAQAAAPGNKGEKPGN
jgi:DNA uptake protein ComE-like DNA-binding protein